MIHHTPLLEHKIQELIFFKRRGREKTSYKPNYRARRRTFEMDPAVADHQALQEIERFMMLRF